jgi:hypothetical protein
MRTETNFAPRTKILYYIQEYYIVYYRMSLIGGWRLVVDTCFLFILVPKKIEKKHPAIPVGPDPEVRYRPVFLNLKNT